MLDQYSISTGFYLKKYIDLKNGSIGEKLNLSGSTIGKIITIFQKKVKIAKETIQSQFQFQVYPHSLF
jgi:hypothetical protein